MLFDRAGCLEVSEADDVGDQLPANDRRQRDPHRFCVIWSEDQDLKTRRRVASAAARSRVEEAVECSFEVRKTRGLRR